MVSEGRISPTAACLQVLDEAKLGSDGRLAAYTAEGQLVLKTFNDFHRTWFPNDNLFGALPMGEGALANTRLIHDEEEGALHVTRALFRDGVAYSEVVTGDSGMEALRTGGAAFSTTTTIPAGLELVQIGDLLGVRKLSLNSNKMGKTIYSDQSFKLPSGIVAINQPLKVNESAGGGILGSKSYMLLNFGRSDELPMNGGLRMPRRWARAIISNLMCRDVPVIRSSDALPFVAKNVLASTPPFRKVSSCMQCHATMDPMGAVARNYSYAFAPRFNGCDPVKSAGYMANWPVSLPMETGVVDDDPDFYKRPPSGKLFLRSYDGTLVDQSVNDISGLGQAIAGTNDFYVCAASKYFQYFTGIKVNLQDVGDPANPALTPADLAYRNQVISLGQNLKKSQSLRSLISEIIDSGIYKKSSMRDIGN